MRVCMIVNNIKTEGNHYTTTLLAQKLHNRKHDVFYIGVEDLSYYPEGRIGGRAVQADPKTYRTTSSYLEAVKANVSKKQKITSADIDVLMLRNDPAEEDKSRAWARVAGISFGQMAIEDGVIVLNDAYGLSRALNKMYFQQFPKEVRPETLISRNKIEIADFFESVGKNIILKPLFGSGGKSVFQVNKDNVKNLNQMIEAISSDGYVVAQEYLPASEKGDTRVFLLNGSMIHYKGKYAALQRVNPSGDIRSNLHVGGTAQPAVITEEIIQIAAMVSPYLVRDGMFFAGLDIIGSKLIEINVFSPGGFYSACRLENTDFTEAVIQSMQHKVYLKSLYQGKLSNNILAIL
ncbi:MAG: glutathione synthetase [Prolixibacteraceae bacterium]